jgi:hypothetical protein
MALTAEQNATLQLLLERGQSYPDLAKVLGVDEAQVRARAQAALTELAGTDPDRNVGITDYLLGQADPIGRADAVRHLRDDPADHALASDLVDRLRELYPDAELPRLPGEPRPARKPKAPKGEGEGAAGFSLGSLAGNQNRLLAILGGGALVLVIVVLAIAGVFGGGDDEEPATEATTTADSADTTTASDDQTLETVELTAQGGGDAAGTAVFGLATNDQAYVDLSIEGLDPAQNGQTYVVWLLLTETQGYPLAPITVTQQGTFNDRFPIPAPVLDLVARVRFVDVSLAPIGKIRNVVSDALENQRLVLKKPGETILSGSIARAPANGGGDQGGAEQDAG